MTKLNSISILQTAGQLFAESGSEGFSIRNLAKRLSVSPSVIYYYFVDEKVLLRAMFDYVNHELGVKRAALSQPKTAKQMLKQRIEFQLDNQDAIVAVLKYYLKFRNTFPKLNTGFVPDKSSLHIEEVLKFGKKTGELYSKNLADDAKVITHAINGFLLEYYPYRVEGKEKTALISRIYSFLIRALAPKSL